MKRNGLCRIVFAVALSFVLCAYAFGCGGNKKNTYSITIADGITGGSVTADKTRVKAGEDVELTLTADAGMVLDYVTVNGAEVSFYDGKYTLFSVVCDCVIDAAFRSSSAQIKFVTGTDEVIASRPAILGSAVGDLPVPQSDGGKKFLGWYDAREGGSLIKKSSLVKSGEFTLYAHWEELSEEYLKKLEV